jgi:hypothetical protein
VTRLSCASKALQVTFKLNSTKAGPLAFFEVSLSSMVVSKLQYEILSCRGVGLRGSLPCTTI